MKLQLLPIMLGLLLQGCSMYPKKTTSTASVSQSKGPPSKDVGGLWELLSHPGITLKFRNVDSDARIKVSLTNGPTFQPIPEGHWELTGFLLKGRKYESMNTSRKFVFRSRSRTNVYAGSIVVRCPSIANSDLKLLKGMSFFNRYPFSSVDGLCEMVIGSDFKKVKSAYEKSRKSKKLNLVMGF